MSGSHRFVIAMLSIFSVAVGAAYYASGFFAFLFAALIITMIYLLRPLLMPAGYGKNKIRILCVAGALGLAVSWGGWSGFANELLTILWRDSQLSSVPIWLKELRFSEQPSVFTLIFVFAVIFIVNYFMRESPIGGTHPIPIDKDFPEESFKRKLEAFCNVLYRDLLTLDQKSNWSPEYYTELQAEVEVLSSSGLASRRKIVNLQDAIRKDRRAKAFLILGVPGAGKSVALRKLARDMFDEVRIGRIPIYINLREWIRPDNENSQRTKFEVSELEEFVVGSLRRRGDVFTEEFVDAYFRKLWRSGRLFFIFDSFDEMSELLDADEDSDVIRSLSEVISRFICSHPLSRGVLASRIFRRPTQAFQAQKILEIRPLSEASISDALGRYPEFNKVLRRKLFSERPDLIPLARNPFMMALLGSWVKERNELPASQPQIFEDYINLRLDTCKSRLMRAGIAVDRVKEVAVEVAWFVFRSSTFGLEAPVKLISNHFGSEEVDSALDVLDYARIARVTQGEDKSFAFVHRRFLEYFVTVKLLSQPESVPISHIPTDSRGRDALVLYAQLCNEDEASQIAQLCWQEIISNFNNPDLRLRAIHCLRFLIDAFGARRSVITPFERELSDFVMAHVSQGENLIMAKICLEATGLLSESQAVPILSVAISGEDSWLQETAFRACRQLPRMNPVLAEKISSYLGSIPDIKFWVGRKSILLSLSLSDGLGSVYRSAKLRLANMKLSILGALLASALSPKLIMVAVFYGFFANFMLVFSRSLKIKGQTKELVNLDGSLRRKGEFSLWVNGSSVFDIIRPVARLMGGVMLVFEGLIKLTGPAGNDLVLSCIWSICENWRIEIMVIYVGLGVLLFDWITIFKLVRYLFKGRKVENFLLAALAVTILVGVTFLIRWLERFPWVSLVIMIFGFAMGFVFSAMFVWWMLSAGWRFLQDFIRLRGIPLQDTLTRSEIAFMFSGFVTSYGQLRFVRMLERERINVRGSWPTDFKLSVGQGESICALARLEERWLRLDR